MFVWDPREHRPYFVKKEDVHRCRLKVPRKARINATRVVEYVPQFDETLQPARREHNPSLSAVTASASPAPREDDTISFSDFEIEEVKVVGRDRRNLPLTPAGLKGWGKFGCQCRFLRPADDTFRPP